MFIKLNKRNGQTTAEYAILIALVVGAAMAMQVYVKRGLNSRIKDAVDHTGAGGVVGGQQLSFTQEGQYEPYYMNQAGQSSNVGVKREQLHNPGSVDRDLVEDEVARASRSTVTGWGAVGEGELATPEIDDPNPVN